MKKFTIFFMFVLLGNNYLPAQSNCDTLPIIPLNIINNPSFESNVNFCSTSYPEYLNKIVPFWYNLNKDMQMVYLNACSNFKVNDSIIYDAFINNNIFDHQVVNYYPVVPLPIPDGNGVVGFMDWGFAGGLPNDSPYRKSYVASCLSKPLKKDSLYQLQFFTGFGKKNQQYSIFQEPCEPQPCFAYYEVSHGTSPSPVHLGLFGLPSCPIFAQQKNIYGCPTRTGWTQLGTVSVSGDTGNWVKSAISFTTPFDIQAIAIGPSCDTNKIKTKNDDGVYEYFLDNLQMYEYETKTDTFPPLKVSMAGGSFCDRSVTLQVNPINSYNGFSFQWFKYSSPLQNETGTALTVTAANYGEGLYKCRAQNDTACRLSDSLNVRWPPLLTPVTLDKRDTTLCNGDTLTVTAKVNDNTASYRWQDGSENNFYNVTKPGIYTVTATNGCGSLQAGVIINYKQCNDSLYLPSAFTPNGDGLNDVFRAKFFYQPVSFKMIVFNRFGQSIFSTSDISKGWDGTFNGTKQLQGAYIWMITYKDIHGKFHHLKGAVVLL